MELSLPSAQLKLLFGEGYRQPRTPWARTYANLQRYFDLLKVVISVWSLKKIVFTESTVDYCSSISPLVCTGRPCVSICPLLTSWLSTWVRRA